MLEHSGVLWSFWGGSKQEGLFRNNKVGIARAMEVTGWGAGWGYLLGRHREQILWLEKYKDTGEKSWL